MRVRVRVPVRVLIRVRVRALQVAQDPRVLRADPQLGVARVETHEEVHLVRVRVRVRVGGEG